ncbi:MAG: restriction endonuclease subunit S [Flavobacteriales bacterium]|nr:restriction endonuclease subunit S [Flavobacteriales bacterium]
MSSRSGEVVAPQYVTHLLAELLKAHNAQSVLDPWSSMPWDALQIQAALPTIGRYDVTSFHGDSAEWISAFGGGNMNGTVAKGWSTSKRKDEASYDAVVSLGPMGMREDRTVRGVDLLDEAGLVEMCAAAESLSGGGQTQETIANSAGWKVGPLVAFSKAVSKVVPSKKGAAEFEPLPEHPLAVYLPTMGSTRATTAQDRLPTKLKSYLQLIVDPAIAHPEYLAHWFNTEAGLLFRSMSSSGTTIPAIAIGILKDSSIPLPPLPQQERMVRTQRVVDQMRLELTEAESAIWASTRSLDEIAGKLPKTDHEARFTDWVETLPFPLASILRHYHAVDRTYKDKRERLLHFFEAFAEFMAIIHLSAYTSDPGRWLLVQEKLKRASNGADLDFRRASFGLWCTVYNALAKETRRMLNEKDEDKQAIADLYSVASQSCLEGLVDKGLSQVLESANNMRNRKADGGVISEAEAEEQHKELAALLQTVRDRLGSSFYSLQLVQAGSADGLPNGASRVSVRVLTGSNPQFKAEDIELVQHVVKGQLYLHEAGREKVLG